MGPDGGGPARFGPLDPFCHLLLVPMEIIGLLVVLLSPSWGGGLLIGAAAAVAVAAVALLDKWINRPREGARLPEDDIPTAPHPAVQQQPRAHPQPRQGSSPQGPTPRDSPRRGPPPGAPARQQNPARQQDPRRGSSPQPPGWQETERQETARQDHAPQGPAHQGSSWQGDLSRPRDPGPSWPDGPSHTR